MKSNTLCYQLLYISSFLVASDENIEIGHENLVGTKICQTWVDSFLLPCPGASATISYCSCEESLSQFNSLVCHVRCVHRDFLIAYTSKPQNSIIIKIYVYLSLWFLGDLVGRRLNICWILQCILSSASKSIKYFSQWATFSFPSLPKRHQISYVRIGWIYKVNAFLVEFYCAIWTQRETFFFCLSDVSCEIIL